MGTGRRPLHLVIPRGRRHRLRHALAELRVLAAGLRAGAAAVRELLALQSSDWAFMVARELAVPYARERFAGIDRPYAGWMTRCERGPLRACGAPRCRPRSTHSPADLFYSQRSVFGASRIRIMRAGTPPTTAFAGTSLVTTALVPMIALSPTLTPRSTQAP